MRRQQRQAILAPTRVAPTPALVVPIATRQAARDDPTAIVPPQYTLAPLVLPPKQPADSAVEAREATTTAFLACMDEMGRVRDKVNVATKAADSHVREVSRELSTEHGNNAAQLREVDSKLDKSETVLRAVRDSIQKLENRIQVVKRAQRNANVALKAGQLLPVLGLIALCVYSLRLVFSLI